MVYKAGNELKGRAGYCPLDLMVREKPGEDGAGQTQRMFPDWD